MKFPWLETIIVSAALAAGYLGGSPSESSASLPPPAAATVPAPRAAAEARDSAASPARWSKIYHAAGLARKAELLEAWMEQDAKALVSFLNGLPRGSVSDHQGCLVRALLRWAEHDPEAAMQAAVGIGSNVTDGLYMKLLEQDAIQAVQLTKLCGELSGLGHPPDSVFEGKGKDLCGILAEQGNNLHGRVFRQLAARDWAAKDRQAAFDFILKQPPSIANDFLDGFLKGLQPEESGQWVSRISDPRTQSLAVWTQMITAGRANPLKALEWATSLPPAQADKATACFFMNAFSSAKDDQLAGIAAAVSEAGWLEAKNQGGLSEKSLLRLAPHLSDQALNILRPQLSAEQRENPEKLPEWIRKLPPEKQAIVLSSGPP